MMEITAQFNKAFKEANESQHRYKLLLGSAGSGKSVNVAQDFILKLSRPEYAGCSLLVVRNTEVSHINSTFAELNGAIDRMGLRPFWESRLQPLSLRNTVTGNHIIFRGANDAKAIERLKSVTVPGLGKLVWVWVEESTEIKQSDLDTIDDRLRGKLPDNHYFQITMSFNPTNASHWLKSAFWDYESEDIFRLKTTYLDNRFIDDAFKKRLERLKEFDPERYEVYALGNWGATGGIIFQNVQFGDYARMEFEDYSIGCDFGFTHATVVLLIGWRDGCPYVIREVYVTDKTTDEIIELCDKADIPKDVLMACDSAEPDRILSLKRAGYRAFPVKKEKNSIKNQIAWLRNRTIYIDGRCVHTMKEIQGYKWRKCPTSGEYTDEPVKTGDDCMAALRYSIELQRKAAKIQSIPKEALGIW